MCISSSSSASKTPHIVWVRPSRRAVDGLGVYLNTNRLEAESVIQDKRVWSMTRSCRDEAKRQYSDVRERVNGGAGEVGAARSRKPESAAAGRAKGGVRAAARELGIDRSEVSRAEKIGGIAPEVKAAAAQGAGRRQVSCEAIGRAS